MIRLFEYGACSILDNRYSKKKFYIEKSFRSHFPKYYDECKRLKDVTKKDLNKFTNFIITIGNKGPDFSKEIESSDVIKYGKEINDINSRFYKIMDYIRCRSMSEQINVIYLGSMSADFGIDYVARPMYAGMKAMHRKIIKNFCNNSLYNMHGLELSMSSVKSRMTDHGDDNKIIFDKILGYITDFCDNNSEYDKYTLIKINY